MVPIDIFPAEFPRDASRHFSEALGPMIAPLARTTLERGPDDPTLPSSLRRSWIAVRGRLLPQWETKLAAALRAHGKTPVQGAQGNGESPA